MTRPRVLVVGLGDTGVLSAIRLSRFTDVVAVSSKPEWFSGQELGMRLTRPQRWERDYRIGFSRFKGLDRVRVVHALATGLDDERRELCAREPSGREVRERYDVLVVTTGVTNGFWRRGELQSLAGLEASLHGAHERLARSDSIAVVGGGAAAVSVAANAAAAWPSTRVELFFPGERALPHHHRRVWSHVRRRLHLLGVRVHPNHRAVLPQGHEQITTGPVQWSTGQCDTPADAVVWAVGRVRPNTGWLPRHLVDEDGFVRVTPALQSVADPSLFAVGDVAATDPLRTSARNRGHALLARNVRAHLAGRALEAYRPPRRRWGSVLGPQHDGLQVFAPDGRPFRFPSWSVDSVLMPWITRRGIYGGVRPPGRDRP
ncbi:MAG TPA: FAD-dependent oxidoreductase [Pedococcus sp.]|nr:FAD-dependent oxidoreductase [Pedococcus sp.]